MKIRIIGVYVGRFNPVHLGHEVVSNVMIKDVGVKNCALVVGSQNHPMTLRHFYSFLERASFLRKLFPEVKILGIPDFDTDDEWIEVLEMTLRNSFTPKRGEQIEFVYYGGCEEDIMFFIERGRKTQIINRFDGTTPKISATEVRDALIWGRPLQGLVTEQLHEDVTTLFAKKWEKFKRI